MVSRFICFPRPRYILYEGAKVGVTSRRRGGSHVRAGQRDSLVGSCVIKNILHVYISLHSHYSPGCSWPASRLNCCHKRYCHDSLLLFQSAVPWDQGPLLAQAAGIVDFGLWSRSAVSGFQRLLFTAFSADLQTLKPVLGRRRLSCE